MNEFSAFLEHPWLHRFGWALFHSLWEGVVVAGVFYAVRAGLRHRSANARYLVSCVALGSLAVLPVATVFCGAGLQSGFSTEGGLPTVSLAKPASTDYGSLGTVEIASWRLGLWHQGTGAVENALSWLVIGWMMGVAGFSCRWIHACWWLRGVKRIGTEPVEALWLLKLEELRERLNIGRPVRLLKSALVEVPMVMGWLRPVILLPAASLSGLTPAQLEAILAHELAHIRRLDYLVNSFQTLLETLMFYHPAVWWISKCIREEREHCCDDEVIRLCGDKVVYARALYTLETLRAHPPLALAASGGPLLARIRRLLTGGETQSPGARELGGLVLVGTGCVLLVVGALLMFRPAKYQARATISIPPVEGRVGSIVADTQPSAYYNPYFLETELALMRSPVVLGRLSKSSASRPLTAKPLESQLAFRVVPGTTLVEILGIDKEAAEAARLANSVAAAYLEYRADQAQHVSSKGIQRLQSKIEELDAQINGAQDKLESLRVELGLSDRFASPLQNPDGRVMTSETLRQIETLRIQSQTELVRSRTMLETLKGLKPDELPLAVTTAVPDTLLNSLLEQVNVTEQKLAALSIDFGPDHPERVRVQSQVNDLQNKIQRRSSGILIGLEAKAGSLEQGIKQLEIEVDQAKRHDIELANRAKPYWTARRNVEELQRLRQVLTDKLFAERTDRDLSGYGATEVVERAIPPLAPLHPERGRGGALMAAGLLSAFLGIRLSRSGQTTQVEPVAG